MPANDNLSGADPNAYATLTGPAVDTAYDSLQAKAIHELPPDADGNAAFHGAGQQGQFPVGELTDRGLPSSAAPGPVNTVPGQ